MLKYQHYKGVFDGCDYDQDIVVNHAVLLVGFGESNGFKSWKLRNSWGPRVGEGGYFRFVYGSTCIRGSRVSGPHEVPIESTGQA